MRRFLGQVFALYVACNMLVCALVFFPWARPRETVSGLIGRWLTSERGWKFAFARRARLIVNALYAWEPNHVTVTHEVERQAHAVLYPSLRQNDGSSEHVH